MNIQDDVALAEYTTMKIGGKAKHLVEIESVDELMEVVNWAESKSEKFRVIGGGSNVLFTDDGYNGLIIVNRIKHINIDRDGESAIIKVGSGENWDTVVKTAVEHGLSGIEALSSIPGTAGATPVQNVGAYGQEISDTLESVQAYDTHKRSIVTLNKSECKFRYRNSIFKAGEKGRYLIVEVTLKLTTKHLEPPFYDWLQKYLDEKDISDYSPASIRKAVAAVRAAKLPDPAKIPNSGSFFKNPEITKEEYQKAKEIDDKIPGYPTKNESIKVPAGWLIESVGLKGYVIGRVGTHEKQALFFVNHGGATYADIEILKEKVISAVAEKFDITLEQEPELIV